MIRDNNYQGRIGTAQGYYSQVWAPVRKGMVDPASQGAPPGLIACLIALSTSALNLL